jgi:DNA-3-methyladenine glycosylase I
MDNLEIREVLPEDQDWIINFLEEQWGDTEVISKGHIHYADELPGLIAVHSDNYVGLATYSFSDNECEIITLNSLVQGMGIGTQLLKAVIQKAASQNCERIWTVVTNDNLDAMRFLQTRGFIFSALHRNAAEKARRIKPEIPSYGMDSIPIRDELELEMNF